MISNRPQIIVKDIAWYYENKGSIEVILRPGDLPAYDSLRPMKSYRDKSGNIKLIIPSRLLRKTLERQSAEEVRV